MSLLIDVCMGVLVLSCGFCAVRLALGPTAADRMVALDTLALDLVGLVGLLAIRSGSHDFFPLVLVFALLGFLGTVCLAKFVGGGDIFE